ncbi:zinc ribbon domain-containing protein [Aestuariirhabdus sp. Z084]|uniref:zinc ribbon domain-containing protein n=1 Tax=Aestuariirhabdus haliotis TaxID=2918751 RepID=UPI00201B454D|nr:zinc ribbon domain-containing protein [Aestuariirhabdus haliotis]MCL6416968.1 zinc ribbon domain-containing protein [Aestuariirhabdus haliotis]MCL6421025.1 zinc ribbon domain-containing protein [Aestuariirhabdus haliotis]
MNNLGALAGQVAIKRKPKGPCPSCGLKVDDEADNCPHCGYKLSAKDRARLREHLKKQYEKGVKLALIVFPVFIGLIVLIYELKNA